MNETRTRTRTRTRNPTPGLGRFMVRVVLFLLPLAVGAGTLLLVPLPRSFAWYFARGDVRGHGLWVHDRIDANPLPIDVAFVGTSRTMLAVRDRTIEETLAERGMNVHVANLGYPRSGNNLHYVIARDLLEARSVRHVVVEVENDEHRASHPTFGYVARTDDLLAAPLMSDTEYIKDLYHGASTRWSYLRHEVLALPWDARGGAQSHYYSRGVPAGLAPAAVLDAAWSRRIAREPSLNPFDRWRLARPRHYIEAIGSVAARHEAKLHFLYLPVYGKPWAEVAHRDLFEAWGDVWIPPEEIFRDRACWLDHNHLNKEGATRLSAWLIEKLAAAE